MTTDKAMTDAGIPMGEGREALFDGEAFALSVRLKMARENLSLRQLETRIGVDQANIHRVAKKGLAPSVETYLRLRAWLKDETTFADTPPPAAAGDRETPVSDLLSDAYRAGYREGCEDSGAEVDSVCLSDGVNQYVTDAILALRTPEPNSGGEDTARLDFLASNSYDLQCFDVPTGGGDADIGWRVVGHWQAEPQERTIAEAFNDDLRAAIDAARAEDRP